MIDEIRLSKTIRYTENFDVPTRLETDEDTLALYRFDEGKGLTLADSSGNKNHGEVRGAQWVTDTAIRHRAALGLVEFGRPAVPVLIKALAHKNPDVQLEAIFALGMIGPDAKSAVATLRLLTDHDDQRIRDATLLALLRIEASGM